LNDLSDKELDKYSRQIALNVIGYEGQKKLRNGSVCIVGLGGLGCQLAIQLTGMGVGHLRLIDRDVVSRSDLHRQYLYDADSVGYPKVEVATEKLKKLNPEVRLDPLPESLTLDNAEEILGNVKVVADGLDGPEPRYIVNRVCNKLKIPYVFGAAIETYGNTSTIIPGKTACLECFMPELKDEDLPKCGTVGVHPSVLGIVTSIQVSEVVRLLINQEPKLQNKLLYIDIGEMTFDIIEIARTENCPICGLHPKISPKPLREKYFQETCARDGRRNFILVPKKKVKINLQELRKILEARKVNIKAASQFGVTFEYTNEVSITILKSGVMIAQTSPKLLVNPRQEIIRTYRLLLIESLGIPREVLPDIEVSSI
jgi:adenylyltransferase/sulfurtransferase